jgi:hypothetical protein
MKLGSWKLAIFAVAALLALPNAVVAGCRCPSLASWQVTGYQWGFGATCSEAEADSMANAMAAAENQCDYGVCAFGSFIQTWPCEPSQMEGHIGQMQFDGKIEYKCLICTDRPPIDPVP